VSIPFRSGRLSQRGPLCASRACLFGCQSPSDRGAFHSPGDGF